LANNCTRSPAKLVRGRATEIELPVQSAVSPDVPGRSCLDALTKAATALNSPSEGLLSRYTVKPSVSVGQTYPARPTAPCLCFDSPARHSSQAKPGEVLRLAVVWLAMLSN